MYRHQYTTLLVPTVRKISTAGFAVQTHGARPKCLSYVRICQLSHVAEITRRTRNTQEA